ncbi:hypothetical protein H2200_007737 [Cladophialophora chaetospira]|uniref:Uncharacterized protein n=1 Tax=Cladophialophora chaetospira TaxID=386627 RepID=A0AA38X6E0_9EURO|nr:hypothetical protein H2200_007737 [Cladophialophora chaetospira]
MLNDIQHPCWSDERLSARFDAQLGQLGPACKTIIMRIEEKLQDIEQNAADFRGLIHVASPAQSPSGSECRRAVGKKLKFAFRTNDALSTSLDELSKLNDTFRILSCQVVRLETELRLTGKPLKLHSHVAKSLDRFRTIKDASVHLYESLCKACDCNHEHTARFSLDINQGRTSPNGHECVHFCLSYLVAPLSNPLLSLAGLPHSSTEGSSVQIISAQQDTNSHEVQMTAAWLHIQSVQSMSAETPAMLAGNSASSQASNAPGHKAVVLETGRPLCTELRHIISNSHGPVNELTPPSPMTLSYSGLFRHLLRYPHKNTQPMAIQNMPTVVPLSKFLSVPGKSYYKTGLPQYQRLGLARVLSGAILQLQGTPWLSKSFASGTIQMVDLGQNAMFPGTSNSDKVHSPFLDVELKLPRATNTSNPGMGNASAITPRLQTSASGPSCMAPNEFLYHLGIVLLELAYQTPFDRLVADVRGDDPLQLPLSTDPQTAEFQIACRLADSVGSSMGADYARIAKKCIRCDFGCGEALDDLALQTRVYEDVFCTLESLENGFRKLQTSPMMSA